MSQRIVVGPARAEREQVLTEKEVDAFNPSAAIARIQEIAAEHPMKRTDEEVIATYDRFVAALPEPNRTMFIRHRAGERYYEIAESMGLPKKVVLKSIAKTFAALTRQLQPQADPQTQALTLEH